MDTGIVERANPIIETLAGRSLPPAQPRRHPAAEPRPPLAFAPLLLGPPPLARALAALAPFGHDARRRERFLAAREEGCCHQCHAPLQNLLNDCPCPHWFITSASTVERVEPVLRMYALADVLQFILMHLAAENAGRALPRNLLAVSGREGAWQLTVRRGRKLWSFGTVPGADGPARLVVGLFNPRTGKHSAVELAATERDVEVMEVVVGAVGGP
ncbi:hypothetical protein [Massilia sp. METH4]|uniref:hypothetical protein n=1 Tax=Massilia sp. METH4 TaxID=3123041 RepID=UPI0030CC6709